MSTEIELYAIRSRSLDLSKQSPGNAEAASVECVQSRVVDHCAESAAVCDQKTRDRCANLSVRCYNTPFPRDAGSPRKGSGGLSGVEALTLVNHPLYCTA